MEQAQQNPQQMQLNPLAVLAAVLMNHGKTDKIKFKPDDSAEEVELEASMVGIANNDEGALCIIPFAKLAECQMNPYVVRFQADSSSLIIFVTKPGTQSGLLGASGQVLINEQKTQAIFNDLMGALK